MLSERVALTWEGLWGAGGAQLLPAGSALCDQQRPGSRATTGVVLEDECSKEGSA